MPGKPAIGAPAATGPGAPNGSGPGATTVAPVAPQIAPACTARYYLVVWVIARYQLG